MPKSAPDTRGTLELMVRQIRAEASRINSYELVDPQGGRLPPFTAGAHIDVHLDNGSIRQYSLANDPAERYSYLVGVLRENDGRGGSVLIHEKLRVRDKVTVSLPRNNFPLVETPHDAILIAGGIGITPLKSMVHSLERRGCHYELHYCARHPENVAFGAELSMRRRSDKVRFYIDHGHPANGLNVAELLAKAHELTHVYCCGPRRLMDACAEATAHWSHSNVHFEHFKPPTALPELAANTDSGSFSVKINSTGQVIPVRPDQSIVEALEHAGVSIETSCEAGLCGTCRLEYLSGEVEHHDCILSDEEHEHFLTACVSRGRGLIVLNL